MSEGDLMGKEKFVLRKERNFIKTIVFMWGVLFLILLLINPHARGPPATVMDLLSLSLITTLLGGSLMWWDIRPLTPLTMIIDWDKELLYLSDRKEESVTVRFNEIKWIVYHDIYRRRGVSVRLLDGQVYAYGVTVDPKDKERLLQAIGRLMEIVEEHKRSRGRK